MKITLRMSEAQPLATVDLKQAIAMLQGCVTGSDYKRSRWVAAQILTQAPGQPEVCQILFRLMYQQGDFAALERNARHCLQYHPENQSANQALVLALRYRRGYAEAISVVEKLLTTQPRAASLHHQLGLLYKECGKFKAAMASFRRCIESDRHFAEVYWSKADLDKNITATELSDIEKQFHTSTSQRAKAQLSYALGRGWEHLQEYDKSFHWYQAGAGLRRNQIKYHHRQAMEEFNAIAEVFSDPAIPAKKTLSAEIRPVFICGLPRSGTSLTEQILAAHPDVTPLGETIELAKASADVLEQRRISKPYPQWVTELTEQDWQAVAKEYLKRVAGRCTTGVFTDKMPQNYKAIGIVLRAFPDAHIIHCCRHSMDTLFGCYKQLFADGNGYTYDFKELADTWLAYQQLMAHWHQLYPGRIYDFHYENLVTQPAEAIPDLLKHLGLKWHQQCLEPHKVSTTVATQSAVQIRQPLNSSGIGAWKAYAKQLTPLGEMVLQSDYRLPTNSD